MIDTKNFKTKTEFIDRHNVNMSGSWGIALDLGYSAVKGYSPNKCYRFPAYARKTEGKLLKMGKSNPTDILYKDKETGEIWAVGEMAQDMIRTGESQDSNLSLYGRNRYFAPMFLVLARTGIGIGLMNNQIGSPAGRKIIIQTGLPPKYLKSDTPLLIEALSGVHEFELKVGGGEWKTFSFALTDSDIRVMPQPMGTFISIATGQDGKTAPGADRFLEKNVLIVDPGFGTFDTYSIAGKLVTDCETFDDLGMKAVLQRTADKIYNKYGTEIQVAGIQKNLATGTFTKFDRKTMKAENIGFADILEESSKEVCNEAIERMKNIYNNMLDHEYLVITGGTGAAWESYFREHFKFMESLKIISGAQNDSLSPVFSNVRGYYMFLQSFLKKQEASR